MPRVAPAYWGGSPVGIRWAGATDEVDEADEAGALAEPSGVVEITGALIGPEEGLLIGDSRLVVVG
jgi:hypothetical protein